MQFLGNATDSATVNQTATDTDTASAAPLRCFSTEPFRFCYLLKSSLSRLPVGGAELPRLQRLKRAENFVHRTTGAERIDLHPLERAVRVDQESAAQSDAL